MFRCLSRQQFPSHRHSLPKSSVLASFNVGFKFFELTSKFIMIEFGGGTMLITCPSGGPCPAALAGEPGPSALSTAAGEVAAVSSVSAVGQMVHTGTTLKIVKT
jgi:hypothetical protein